MLLTLSECPEKSLDLILAADVWIYVGDLNAVFSRMVETLRSTGYIAFSIELLLENSQGSFKLAKSGRFQHSEEYIKSLIETFGLVVLGEKQVTVRMESNEPIVGIVYLLQLPSQV